jgi:hypothetical protein
VAFRLLIAVVLDEVRAERGDSLANAEPSEAPFGVASSPSSAFRR